MRLWWWRRRLLPAPSWPALVRLRSATVLVLRGGKWLVLQYNLELTIPNDRFDAVKEAAGAAQLFAPSLAHASVITRERESTSYRLDTDRREPLA